jgi:pimeloyl-ACP methyl ester carboxylesterase
MPHLNVNGCDYFYLDTGAPKGRPHAETIVFGHGFLMTHQLFEKQIEALRGEYRCIAFDWRGQGRSEFTRDGYGLWDLTEDAAALIERLDADPCHYAGHSMGGYVGFRLALLRPDLLASLALLDTQAAEEPWGKRLQYYLMLSFVRLFGYRPLVTDRVMPIMFGPAFRNDPARREAARRWRDVVSANDRRGVFRTGLSIFSRESILDDLPLIETPALLVVGENDIATPPSTARPAHAQLPQSELVVVPESGHSAPIEQPEAVSEALAAFLKEHRTAAPLEA